MNHYVYLITVSNPTDSRRFYIGVRSCNCLPEEDSRYFGSCKSFSAWQKENGVTGLSKQVLSIFDTRKEAVAYEVFLHNILDVAVSPIFFNRAKQTNERFDTSGAKIHSEKRKLELSEFFKKLPRTEEQRKKISEAMRGNSYGTYARGKKRAPLTAEHKAALSAAKVGRPKTDAHRAKIRAALTGLKRTDAQRKYASEIRKGIPPVFSPTRHEKVECPHCRKTGMKANMKRYHFDNCKSVVGPY